MGFFAEAGPLQIFVSSHLIPEDFEYSQQYSQLDKPALVFGDEEVRFQASTDFRLRIVGTRTEAREILRTPSALGPSVLQGMSAAACWGGVAVGTIVKHRGSYADVCVDQVRAYVGTLSPVCGGHEVGVGGGGVERWSFPLLVHVAKGEGHCKVHATASSMLNP